MKKIFIICLMLVGVGVGAATTLGPDGSFNTSGTGSDFNNSGTGSDFNNSGTGSNFNNSGNINSPSNSLPPLVVQADRGVPKVSLAGIVAWLSSLLNQAIYLIVAASLVMFLYGVFKLSFVDGLKPESREQARKFMFWGIVSLFVMVSVWGLVNILKFSLFGGGPLIIPQLR